MKKVLLTLSLFLGIIVLGSAQVTISGTVTDANGDPLGNYPVEIIGDTTVANPYYNMIFTNPNGTYTDVAPTNTTQGSFDIAAIDSCTGNYHIQTITFSPAQMSFTNVDFTICPVTNLCQAAIQLNSINTTIVSMSASSTGTAPFNYTWDMGDGTSYTGANISHTYSQLGVFSVCVSVTDATGCMSVQCYLVSIVAPANIGGLIVYDTTNITTNVQAVVYLIEYDSIAGTLTAVDIDTTYDGSFLFPFIPFGSYYVKAALLPSDPNYVNYLPTYFGESLHWSNASRIDLDTFNLFGGGIIDLVKGNNISTGPGFIGGLITQGANGPGDPLADVSVLLFDANMNPISHTVSDEDGNYSFDNLPYGVYYIYVEELGLQTAPIQVSLSPTTPSMEEINFEVGSSYVMFTKTNKITSINSIKAFPNPVVNELNVQFNTTEVLDVNISITNLTGQVLVSERRIVDSGMSNISILVSDLSAGVYMLRIQNEEGVMTEKFIKR